MTQAHFVFQKLNPGQQRQRNRTIRSDHETKGEMDMQIKKGEMQGRVMNILGCFIATKGFDSLACRAVTSSLVDQLRGVWQRKFARPALS